MWDRLASWYKVTKRRLRKSVFVDHSPAHTTQDYQRRKHPDVMLDDLRRRIGRFQQLLGHDGRIKVDQIYPQIFRIST